MELINDSAFCIVQCIVSFAQFVLHIRGSIRYIVGVHNDLWCAAVFVHMMLVVHVFGITSCIFNAI